MARITSKSMLVDYIKSTLGAPIIKVDVTDTQIENIIDNAVQKFTEYAYGTLEAAVVIQLNGKGEYAMPDTMTNLLKLSKGGTSNLTNFNANFGSGYVPNIWSQQYFSGSLTGDIIPAIIGISTTTAMLEKYFGDDIVYNFNPHRKVLQVLEAFEGPAVLYYQYEYLANEQNDLIYNHEWIKEYTVAQTRYQWGNNTGKIDREIVGGGKINYNDMKSEATSEIERLNGELLTKWSDTCPILIG